MKDKETKKVRRRRKEDVTRWWLRYYFLGSNNRVGRSNPIFGRSSVPYFTLSFCPARNNERFVVWRCPCSLIFAQITFPV